jgi:hypothetical protein
MRARVAEIQNDVKEEITSIHTAAMRANSVNAAVLVARTRRFRAKLWADVNTWNIGFPRKTSAKHIRKGSGGGYDVNTWNIGQRVHGLESQ